MKIKHYTPLARMQHTGIYRKGLDWYKELADDYHVDENLLFSALVDFTAIPFRLNGHTPKGLDFAFATMEDDSETLRDKFVAYLNTESVDALAAIEQAIKAFDAPVNSDTAPDTPSDPEA
jgi:hypothetical protein